ncbi:MAG: NAD(P)/FAD-dependent oxidoreductase [Leptospiraceae bacterium]|nr:NAD(P)/FAD-dependent oxidoreductase [Leptospiraceae bacterium]
MEKHVIVVGAGFGGLQIVKKLGNKKNFRITLIDKTNHHLFQPLLYQVASSVLSPADIAIPTRSLTSKMKNVKVLMCELVHIDKEKNLIQTDHGELKYDYLVLAMGAVTSYFGNSTWKQYAPGLKNISDALEIRNKILISYEKAEMETDPSKVKKLLTFVIIGGGPTGVELAGSIAELSRHIIKNDFRSIDPSLSDVLLIEAGPRILPQFSVESSNIAKANLEKRGVKVYLNTKVKDILPDSVITESGIFYSLNTIWAAGISGNPFSAKLNSDLDRSGRVLIDENCNLPGSTNIFCIGDMANFKSENGIPLPGVSPVAMQQGRYVADRMIAMEKGINKLNGFQYFDKGSMATIGRKDAVAEIKNIKLNGFIGWMSWLFIHLFYQIGFKNKVSILITWIWSYISFKAGARLIQPSWSNLRDKTEPENDSNQKT